MEKFNKLSELSTTILGWKKKANDIMDIDSFMVYLEAWDEVFHLMAKDIRRG